MSGDENTLVDKWSKRRNTVQKSLDKLGKRIVVLEEHTDDVNNPSKANLFATKLESLSPEFKTIHYHILNFYNEQGDLNEQQLDSTVKDLDQLEKDEGDSAQADQNRDRLIECKKHLDNIYEQIANLCIRSDNALLTDHYQLEDEHFSCARRLKSVTKKFSSQPPPETSGNGKTRIAKLDIPTFDGEILNWQKYWNQFEVAVHSQKSISSTEKLRYLEQAVHRSPAVKAIMGLSRTGAQYEQAIKYLKERYYWPPQVFRK